MSKIRKINFQVEAPVNYCEKCNIEFCVIAVLPGDDTAEIQQQEWYQDADYCYGCGSELK